MDSIFLSSAEVFSVSDASAPFYGHVVEGRYRVGGGEELSGRIRSGSRIEFPIPKKGGG